MSSQLSQVRSRVPRIAEAAVERARLTVVPRAARRPAARMPFVVLVSLLLIGGVAGLLYFNTTMQQVSFTTTALQQRAQTLEAKRQGLQMALDGLRDPQRVALEARRLGMVPAPAPAFIRLSDGKVLGKAAAADGSDEVRLTPLPTRRPKSLRTKVVTVISKNPAVGGAATRVVATRTGTKKTRHR
jgi:hypothetical protein